MKHPVTSIRQLKLVKPFLNDKLGQYLTILTAKYHFYLSSIYLPFGMLETHGQLWTGNPSFKVPYMKNNIFAKI